LGNNSINALALVDIVVAAILSELTPVKKILKTLPSRADPPAEALERWRASLSPCNVQAVAR
jgi:hypothetical protein